MTVHHIIFNEGTDIDLAKESLAKLELEVIPGRERYFERHGIAQVDIQSDEPDILARLNKDPLVEYVEAESRHETQEKNTGT